MTFQKTGLTTANVHYGIQYADGDETYDRLTIDNKPGTDPVVETAKIFVDMFDNLSFNADIKTWEQVKDHIDEMHAEEYAAVRRHIAESMASRMGIPVGED